MLIIARWTFSFLIGQDLMVSFALTVVVVSTPRFAIALIGLPTKQANRRAVIEALFVKAA